MSERRTEMRKLFKVEVKTKKGILNNVFETKQQAEDYAVIVSTFQGFKYRITEIFVNEEVVK